MVHIVDIKYSLAYVALDEIIKAFWFAEHLTAGHYPQKYKEQATGGLADFINILNDTVDCRVEDDGQLLAP